MYPYRLSRQGRDCVCLISLSIAGSSLAQINALDDAADVSISRWPKLGGEACYFNISILWHMHVNIHTQNHTYIHIYHTFTQVHTSLRYTHHTLKHTYVIH